VGIFGSEKKIPDEPGSDGDPTCRSVRVPCRRRSRLAPSWHGTAPTSTFALNVKSRVTLAAAAGQLLFDLSIIWHTSS
jgi:hypothetical protein